MVIQFWYLVSYPNTATTQPPTTIDMGTSKSQSTALVAGAVGGTVGVIVIVAVVAILVVKYKWRHAAKPQASLSNPDIRYVRRAFFENAQN